MVYYSNPGTQEGVQNKDFGTVTESLVSLRPIEVMALFWKCSSNCLSSQI